jgi:hypothetical protein
MWKTTLCCFERGIEQECDRIASFHMFSFLLLLKVKKKIKLSSQQALEAYRVVRC